jgi:hypothetical protein
MFVQGVDGATSFPLPSPTSQLIPVVIEQRRLCICPHPGNFPRGTECGSVEVKAKRFLMHVSCAFGFNKKVRNDEGKAYIIYLYEEEKSTRKTGRKSVKAGSC